MNKKGFFGDIGLVLAVLLLLSVMVLVGYKVFSSYNEKWQDNTSIDSGAKTLVQTNKDRYVGLWDGIFMFVFAMLTVALFISVVAIGTRPEFFFITLILLVIFLGGSAMISNVYESVSTDSQLNTTSSEFSFMPFLMDELPTVTLLLGFLVMVGLYVKIRGFL